MSSAHEALWRAVYAASFNDSEGLDDMKLADIAEKRADEAVARWERRVARVAPAYQPTTVTTQPDVVETQAHADLHQEPEVNRNGGTRPPPSMSQRHARA